jgi:hypothetical protein
MLNLFADNGEGFWMGSYGAVVMGMLMLCPFVC